jgi:hypothetical protein
VIPSETPLSRYRQALLSLALGEPDKSLLLLSASYEDREAELPCMAVDPRFDIIRQTSQLGDILRGVGLGLAL